VAKICELWSGPHALLFILGLDAQRTFIEVYHALLLDARCALVRRVALLPNGRRALIRHVTLFLPMGNTWVPNGATRSDKVCHPLLVTESKIVTPFSKNCYIKAQDAQNSHK
jgi:hypothetical protein